MNNAVREVMCMENSTLANVLQKQSDAILLLDCRPFLAYNSHHIAKSQNIHCPTILKRRSKGTVSLENIVTCEESRTKLLNGVYKSVVAYDQHTSTCEYDHIPKDCDMELILHSLLQDPLVSADLYFLRGGFDKFSMDFSSLCVGQECEIASAVPMEIIPTTSLAKDCYSDPIFDQGQPVEILPFIYLGSSYHSSRKDMLDALGITSLLNVSTTCPNYFPDDYTYKRIPVDDNSSANISAWFLYATDFIDSVKVSDGRVLVHCQAGISRSATICLAYLMRALHYRLDEAFEFVKSRRRLISPNFNFMSQLLKFESETLPPMTSRDMQSTSTEIYSKSPQKIAVTSPPPTSSSASPLLRQRRRSTGATQSPMRKSRRKSTEDKENHSI
nr:PREDICTED: dual specificity protein phosphatase 1-B-like [Saccoglossus kowalevskii]